MGMELIDREEANRSIQVQIGCTRYPVHYRTILMVIMNSILRVFSHQKLVFFCQNSYGNLLVS